MSRRLVLFDIDGTILSSNGAAPRAFREALAEVYGCVPPTNGYSFAGRTDPRIAWDLLTMAGIEAERIEAGFPMLWTRYLANLEEQFETIRPTVYPGIIQLIEEVGSATSALPGLLTGNIAGGAKVKLEAAGLRPGDFLVGAYGSDHHDRTELPAVAVHRAEEATGYRFEGKEIVIIGDTPADVACGAHLGVRTIAVATGTFSSDQLAECEPDYLFEDFSDVQAAAAAIFE